MIRRNKKGTGSDWRICLHKYGVLAAIALASQLIWFAAAPSHDRHQAPTAQPSAGVSFLATPALTHSSFPREGGELHGSRLVYPYSVIPGGVESADELRKAVATDPVVAVHYSGFEFAHAHLVRLTQVRAVFVSYRKGNTVFWTSKKLKLPAGETLITDGMHSSRTRCGNQISDEPRTPTAPDGEPTPKTLNTPLVTANIEQTPINMPLVGGDGGTGGIPPGGPIIVGGGGGSGGIPPGVPIIGGGGGNPPSSDPPSPVPITTPEPGTLLLTATGLGAAWLARKLRKS